MNPEAIEMLGNARVPYQAIGQPGERAVIVADYQTPPLIWEIFAAAAHSCGLAADVVMAAPLARDYEDPNPVVRAAIEAADIVHYVTTRALVHSRFGRDVSRRGKKKIISEQITPDMLRIGAVTCDMNHLNRVNAAVNDAWEGGSEAHVTTELGTDLVMSIEGRKGFVGANNQPKAGFDLGGGASVQFPGGEAPVAPVEDTAEGVLVIDKSMHHPEGFLQTPVRLQIEKGTIKKITGGEEAEEFSRWLKSFADDDAYRVAELSCGTNEAAIWMGNLRQDRYVLGGMHIGFGMNADVGGDIDSNVHYDCAFSKVTLSVDGTPVLQSGRFVL